MAFGGMEVKSYLFVAMYLGLGELNDKNGKISGDSDFYSIDN